MVDEIFCGTKHILGSIAHRTIHSPRTLEWADIGTLIVGIGHTESIVYGYHIETLRKQHLEVGLILVVSTITLRESTTEGEQGTAMWAITLGTIVVEVEWRFALHIAMSCWCW